MSKKKFTVKASDKAKSKKSCSSSSKKDVCFKADMVNCDEEFYDDTIVLFLDGKQVFKGSMDSIECRHAFERICEREDVYDMLARFCNSFGDDVIYSDDSPADVGSITWDIIRFDLMESDDDFYEDFGQNYRYNDPRLECFLAKDMT